MFPEDLEPKFDVFVVRPSLAHAEDVPKEEAVLEDSDQTDEPRRKKQKSAKKKKSVKNKR